jgi:hypothetical protein
MVVVILTNVLVMLLVHAGMSETWCVQQGWWAARQDSPGAGKISLCWTSSFWSVGIVVRGASQQHLCASATTD